MTISQLTNATQVFTPVVAKHISTNLYHPIDLTAKNIQKIEIDIANHLECQKYIDEHLKTHKAKIAYGGYLEKRGLYDNKPEFNVNGELRNIHLGVDFWALAGTPVLSPLDAEVHSFANNSTFGDYGPTIILKHELNGTTFYTLYGHLAIASLTKIYEGKKIKAGESFATLGTPDINVGYAPHLHFQIILDLQGYQGTYPGVSTPSNLAFYKVNCPNPNLLLKFE